MRAGNHRDVEFAGFAQPLEFHRRPPIVKPASSPQGERDDAADRSSAPLRGTSTAPPLLNNPSDSRKATSTASLISCSDGLQCGKYSGRKRVESCASAKGSLAITACRKAPVCATPRTEKSSRAVVIRLRAISRSAPK